MSTVHDAHAPVPETAVVVALEMVGAVKLSLAVPAPYLRIMGATMLPSETMGTSTLHLMSFPRNVLPFPAPPLNIRFTLNESEVQIKFSAPAAIPPITLLSVLL